MHTLTICMSFRLSKKDSRLYDYDYVIGLWVSLSFYFLLLVLLASFSLSNWGASIWMDMQEDIGLK